MAATLQSALRRQRSVPATPRPAVQSLGNIPEQLSRPGTVRRDCENATHWGYFELPQAGDAGVCLLPTICRCCHLRKCMWHIEQVVTDNNASLCVDINKKFIQMRNCLTLIHPNDAQTYTHINIHTHTHMDGYRFVFFRYRC